MKSFMAHKALLAAGLALVLGAVNFAVWQKERLIANGTTVLLRLAPVDPRSLIQGDYMRLDYALLRNLPSGMDVAGASVLAGLTLGDGSVATRLELSPQAPPVAGEARMLMRRNGAHQWRLGSDAYFFQEGTAARYERARYGEYRTDVTGESVLVALRDEKLERIGDYRLGHRWQLPVANAPAPNRRSGGG